MYIALAYIPFWSLTTDNEKTGRVFCEQVCCSSGPVTGIISFQWSSTSDMSTTIF